MTRNDDTFTFSKEELHNLLCETIEIAWDDSGRGRTHASCHVPAIFDKLEEMTKTPKVLSVYRSATRDWAIVKNPAYKEPAN